MNKMVKMRWLILSTEFTYITGIILFLTTLSANAVNITFNGQLINYPCQLDKDSDNRTVEFFTHSVKDFYSTSGKGSSKTFNIRLNNCSTNSVWKAVKIKFTGDNEPGMRDKSDYFLRVMGSGNEGKLAVGLLDTDGTTPLKLGDVHNNKQGTPLKNGSMDFTFTAFIQATPDAIENKSVQPGPYTSMANFELLYE